MNGAPAIRPLLCRRVSRVTIGLFLAAAACIPVSAVNLVSDPGFELQGSNTVSAPWVVEGPDGHGIDRALGFSHTGSNDAWIRDSTANWNAIAQWVAVSPNTNYTLVGFVQNNFTTNMGYFGVRASDGVAVIHEASFSALAGYKQLTVNFNSGSNSRVLVYAGFWGQSTDYWLRIDDVSMQQTINPPQSTFFASVGEEGYSTYQLSGDGDLWPSCWADDGNLYSANGDGTAFTGNSTRYDMAVSRILGNPPNLSGVTLATNVGTNWGGSSYNRKPTGMACVGGAIYLAFQNINMNTFDDASAASIAKSTDHGQTWSWDSSAPMFGTPGNPSSPLAYLFTTIFFADFGANSANAIDGYVYAYGLDDNWREQTALYLARVPNGSIQSRSAWSFYTGTDGNGNPLWSNDITVKAPVLVDDRVLYQTTFGTPGCPANNAVIGQGGVVYDAPLQRFLFSSWSCSTHELYEAPHPWGPWSLFYSKDFTPLRLTQSRGQYGTSIPSKYISSDGKTLWLQSNVCCTGDSYTFSLRQLFLSTWAAASPTNGVSDTENLASPGHAPRAISKSSHFGMVCGAGCSDSLNDGNVNQNEDDFDNEVKSIDWWGYTWPTAYNMNKVVYVTGNMFPDGGWYASGLQVQVRQNFQWVNVNGLTIAPSYPYSNSAGTNQAYTFWFQNTWGDGVRIIGTPGGSSRFTSIGELAVYYDTHNLVVDPGFEFQTGSTVSGGWATEGPDNHGIDRGLGFAHSGNNNAWIRDSTTNWNAVTQWVAVAPNTNYTLTGWVQNNFTTNLGYFGLRTSDGVTVLRETSFSAAPGYTQLTVTFNSGSNSTVKVYAGFWGQNADLWLRLDDVSLHQ